MGLDHRGAFTSSRIELETGLPSVLVLHLLIKLEIPIKIG